ncbi:hypothetical protein [Streptomyces sp. NRRL F-5135]|uniref:hypothetical protein n=1 Tax=Streptomyces sp. NRRL F-5135 TaxID=1463858 RepID=UPI00131D638F|nr:hypothetical protein [Streptomyces sp. NRRL F-5135]
MTHQSSTLAPPRCQGQLRTSDEHLRARLGNGANPAWLRCADVLCADAVLDAPAALRLLRRTLDEYPGCLLAEVRLADGGCLALCRSGREILVRGSMLRTRQHALVASLLHGWVASGVQLPAGGPSSLLIRSRSRPVSLGLIER